MHPLKIYVAGCFAERENIRQFMKVLRERGHTITHDWTSCESVHNDYHHLCKRYATWDIKGVVDADLVIAIMTNDDYAYWGTRHEIGAALALRELHNQNLMHKAPPKIWIVANADPRQVGRDDLPECMKCLFEHMADEYYKSLADILLDLPAGQV